MRVTQGMLNTQMMRNLNNNLSRLKKIQDQLSTGRNINQPSDDPVGISFALRYRNALAANEQYIRNVDSARSWVDYTESIISETNDVLQRARELAVQGANGTNSDQSRDSIAAEIEQLYDHLVSLGNSQFNGKYIFNGQMTDIKPYDSANAKDATPHKGNIEFEVGVGITIPVNVSGADLFGEASDSTNVFRVMENLKNALYSNDQDGINQALSDIDTRLDLIQTRFAEIGARSNRIELISKRLESESINLTQLLSKTEDADMAELMINIKTEENIYQASLSTGARIIQPSLIDFLR
ncbi:flagellar biosynthesis protein FlgL [Vulcanibacillus modesticaldus]|uniref:Flagellar biosynthesis protein FlgL n=1 Tax=Vulcanibacillus modesticaldus TaxID=337097 RepID=A0A1D2YUW8_9BACI|nr:flagellar hook-associated protein FlgL [Vulcanibacillus modesticaldus]OEF99500.1 flagellar biosynthesis protein FlgL [Vulcanibacillus modesticaldus]